MLSYYILEISGRQYKAMPNKPFLVDFLGELTKLECEKVLLKSEDGKVLVGTPYLKEKVVLDVSLEVNKQKIRVAKFKSKANYRKVIGGKVLKSEVVLQDKSREKSK